MMSLREFAPRLPGIAALCLLLCTGAWAQNGAEPVAWNTLTGEQQSLLARYSDDWDSFPADRQHSLARGSQRWLEMGDGERAAARERFARWSALSSDQRERIRGQYQRFRNMTPEQQQRLRQNFERYRSMTPEQRNQLRERWGNMSPDDRRRALEQRRGQARGKNKQIPPRRPQERNRRTPNRGAGSSGD